MGTCSDCHYSSNGVHGCNRLMDYVTPKIDLSKGAECAHNRYVHYLKFNTKTMTKKITDFIDGKITYDKFGQKLWINNPKYGSQMLADLRGWGAIQNMFKGKGETIDTDAAGKFQDEVGEWIAEAINEKLEREKTK
jgi:hypothetical protein